MLRIKELRLEKGLSQKDIARGINTSQRSISRWENGDNEPTFSALCELSEFFDVSIDYLCGKNGDEFISYASPLRKDEKIILKKYNDLSENDKNKVIGYLDALIKNKRF